jgi:malate synthase
VIRLASEGIVVRGATVDGCEEILTPDALRFVAELHRCFEPKRRDLMAQRAVFQAIMDAGGRPGFLDETRAIREGEWRVSPLPPDLRERRVEYIGSVDRQAIIDGLNSTANVYIASFDDATAPTWEALVGGQALLRQAVRGIVPHEGADGPRMDAAPVGATLMIQPRGWHAIDSRLTIDDQAVSAALFDAGLYLYHNAEHLSSWQSGAYFSLSKLEGRQEARLWNEVLLYAQHQLNLPAGAVRATLVIDTVSGAFEAEEMLFELRDYAVGLTCDRWNYILSFIKTFQSRPESMLPDAGLVTMERHFLHRYAELVVGVAHRRGVPAIGVPVTQVPIPSDAISHRVAMARVMADKSREARLGFDGSRVAHRDLVRLTRGAFDAPRLRGASLSNPADPRPSAKDLLTVPEGPITEAGLRHHVTVCLCYLESWLRGKGTVPVRHDLADRAVVEAARAQLWHWMHRGAVLEDGRAVTQKLYSATADYEMGSIRRVLGDEDWALGEFGRARDLLDALVICPTLDPFLTRLGMEVLLEIEASLR